MAAFLEFGLIDVLGERKLIPEKIRAEFEVIFLTDQQLLREVGNLEF